MFKITSRNDSGTIRLIVDGKLTRACVSDLDRCWQAAKLLEPERSILMDLTGVTFIDECGKELLARMHEEGTAFLCAGLMTKFLIEEIKNAEIDEAGRTL
jgi:anti-anti-sigma regulatory factor